MSTPATRKWGAPCRADIVNVRHRDLVVPTDRRIAEIVEYLLIEGDRRGYFARNGQTWGGICRKIANSNTWSSHAWWLAVDVNSLANPYGSPKTDMPAWYINMWESLGFMWGGRWKTPDAMHYEFIGTPQDAQAITQEVRRRRSGKPSVSPGGQAVSYNSPAGNKTGFHDITDSMWGGDAANAVEYALQVGVVTGPSAANNFSFGLNSTSLETRAGANGFLRSLVGLWRLMGRPGLSGIKNYSRDPYRRTGVVNDPKPGILVPEGRIVTMLDKLK